MEDHPVILFDGVCNFCNGSINFLMGIDKKDRFRFAPLQSVKGNELLKQADILTGSDSFILLYQNKVYDRSSATLKVLSLLPWYWQWTQIFWMVPKFIRDGIYNYVARNRYRWFGKKEKCMIPTPGMKKRFL